MSKNEYADFEILQKSHCEHDALNFIFRKTVCYHNIFIIFE